MDQDIFNFHKNILSLLQLIYFPIETFVWYQHDGILPHYALAVRRSLDDIFSIRGFEDVKSSPSRLFFEVNKKTKCIK